MKKYKLRRLRPDEWQEHAEACNSATFFHTRKWHEIWLQYHGRGEFAGWQMTLESGDGYLSGIIYKGKLNASTTLASPAGTYGGLLSDGEVTTSDVINLNEQLRKHFSSFRYLQSPFINCISPPAPDALSFTQYLELSDKSPDEQFRTWSKGHSSAAKRGLREGVTTRIATSEKDWDDYFDAYQTTLARWGDAATNRYSKKLFRLIQHLPNEVCQLWLSEKDDCLLCGCLCFYWNHHVVYWHGANTGLHPELKGVHVAQYHIIRDAITRGFRYYDFNPSGGHEGVVKFKKGFGAQRVELSIFNHTSAWSLAVANAKSVGARIRGLG